MPDRRARIQPRMPPHQVPRRRQIRSRRQAARRPRQHRLRPKSPRTRASPLMGKSTHRTMCKNMCKNTCKNTPKSTRKKQRTAKPAPPAGCAAISTELVRPRAPLASTSTNAILRARPGTTGPENIRYQPKFGAAPATGTPERRCRPGAFRPALSRSIRRPKHPVMPPQACNLLKPATFSSLPVRNVHDATQNRDRTCP